jgi:D-3-phosphoglycerate dehydrogenase
MSLLLAFARRIFPLTSAVRRGDWRDVGSEVDIRRSIRRLRGQSLGVIGYGKIGRAVAQRARSFGLRILANDPYVDFSRVDAGRVVPSTLSDLLAGADYVSLHVPLTQETRGLIGTEELKMMKPSAVLLNLSRGAIVDEDALSTALEAGRIHGAALDVLAQEPPPSDHPFLHLDNALVTPHFGAASKEAIEQQEREASESVAAVLRGCWPPHVVNEDVIPKNPLSGRGRH